MRKPTGQAIFRAGRWVARVILHRLPRGASGKHPTAQRDVVRDGKPVTGRTKADRAHARRAAERLQGRYDDGSWEPEAAPPPAPEAPTAGPTVSAWVDSWCAGQSYSEAPRDRAKVAAYLPRTRLGNLLLPEVTPQSVAAWVEELRREPFEGIEGLRRGLPRGVTRRGPGGCGACAPLRSRPR